MWIEYNRVYSFLFPFDGKSRKAEVGGILRVCACAYLCVFPITQWLHFLHVIPSPINSDFLIHLQLLYSLKWLNPAKVLSLWEKVQV